MELVFFDDLFSQGIALFKDRFLVVEMVDVRFL
jgi:hypothetical protein